ncbi:MAG: hypothetical protein WB608_16220 [Terracidiphilus sp.]
MTPLTAQQWQELFANLGFILLFGLACVLLIWANNHKDDDFK